MLNLPDKVEDLVFKCCYCGRKLTADEDDTQGVAHTDIPTGNVIQIWYSHISCFRRRLHPDMRVFYDDERS